MSIGIGKKELLNDYYLDEMFEVIEEHNRMHTYEKEDDEKDYVGVADFFGF